MILTCPTCNKQWSTLRGNGIAKAYCSHNCCDKSISRLQKEINKIAELKTPITYADFLKKHPDCLEID